MYKTSSGAKELTQIKKNYCWAIFLKQNSHKTCIQKIYWWSLYYMCKDNWFTKKSRSSKFMSFSNNKKLKVISIQNIILKIKLQNIKEKYTNGLMIIKVHIFVKMLIIILFITII